MITNYVFDDLFLTHFAISLRTRIDIVETFFAFQVQPAKVKETLRPVNFSKQFKRSKWRKSLDAFIFMIPLPPQPHAPNELFPLHSRRQPRNKSLAKNAFFNSFHAITIFPPTIVLSNWKDFPSLSRRRGKSFLLCPWEATNFDLMASARSFIIKLLKVFLPASLLSTLLGAALAAGGKSIEKTSGKTLNSFHCSQRFVIEPFRLWSVRRLWKARVRWWVIRGIVNFSIKLSERTFKVSYWKLIK